LHGQPSSNAPLLLDGLQLALQGTRPAGTVSGQARWDAHALTAQLSLADVAPQQLLQQAPAATVSGRVDASLVGLALPGQPPAGGVQGGGLQGQARLTLGGPLERAGTPALRLQAASSFSRTAQQVLQLTLSQLEAQAGDGRLTGTARLQKAPNGPWQVRTQGELARFDPGAWVPAVQGQRIDGQVSGRWQADVAWQPGARSWLQAVRGQAEATISPSRIAGLALNGQGRLDAGERATVLDVALHAGPNDLRLQGRARSGEPQWQAQVHAPALEALAPLRALLPGRPAWFPEGGSVQADASFSGSGEALRTEGRLQVQRLRSPLLQLARAESQWRIVGLAPPDPVNFSLDAQTLAFGAQRLDRLQARAGGTLAAHTLQVDAQSPLQPPAWVLAAAQVNTGSGRVPAGSAFHLAVDGHWQPRREGGEWSGVVQALDAAPRVGRAPWLAARALALRAELGAGFKPERLQLAPGRIALFGGGVRWQQAAWQAQPPGQRPLIDLDAQIEPLQVAPLLQRLQPQFGWQGDLALGGRVQLHTRGGLNADAVIERQRGDVAMRFEGVQRALGLQALRVSVQARQGRWLVREDLAGSGVGLLQGTQSTSAAPDGLFPGAGQPLAGGLDLRVPDLRVWSPWMPVGWQAAGQVVAQARLGGRVGAPQISGTVNGSHLAVDNLFEGIHLRDGALALALQGDHATLQRLSFRAGDGTLQATGHASFGTTPVAQLRVTAQHFRALDRVDRRIDLSGGADASFQGQRLALSGRFRVDNGLVDVAQADTPKLGKDVIVVHAPVHPGDAPRPAALSSGTSSSDASGASQPTTPKAAPDVHLAIDLGDDLRLHGRGIDAKLKGQLAVTTPHGELAIEGVVRAVDGTYTAYGQNLAIERGTLSFNGEVANPTLDVLAVRPDLDIRVGVQVTGHASDPRVRLYSEPAMAEMDTLTWLLLGRAPEGLGRDDTALLQRAALALFAGDKGSTNKSFLKQIGLDQLSVRQGNNDAEGTIVSLGKQVSKRLFVGYERALAAAGGTWELIYRIYGRLTLRARTGDEESLDAVWTWHWD
jgi:translocation and assembly module TamB